MYSTCVWCYAELGKNETIEHFPVGRRLAFDAATGRLWVVCRRCKRWNLTPIEERWEAIEECERRFTSTRLRVSTDEIGLVRVDDGLDLIRIGAPLRPEMASWRYSDRFARRRKGFLALTGAAVAGWGYMFIAPRLGALEASAMSFETLLSMGISAFTVSRLAPQVADWFQKPRMMPRVRIPDHDTPVTLHSLVETASIGRTSDGWWLSVSYDKSASQPRTMALARPSLGMAILRGDDALLAAGKLLPLVNARGASTKNVGRALGLLNETPNAQDLFSRFAPQPSEADWRRVSQRIADLAKRKAATDQSDPASLYAPARKYIASQPAVPESPYSGVLSKLPSEIRLAMEMATHEDTERRAMEGELELLTQAWHDAAEIAAISDNMFLPEKISRQLRGMTKSE